ncbi:YfdX family protein [Acetobacter sp. TBRC 12305]|uniref:YfdX family protein n=1 Tax=Acetobacter garciniae TaxID=2817435 RepID=A0A939KP87_9PROT|nr:YfdX family protein [Acetobacter garciniae]MBO1326560.1 YfdX family protein [Acetobacter garciniae]MBX0346257.1 YfdX family protein [Acetobacter garciniae]
MRLKKSLMLAAAFMVGISTAQAASLHTQWEKFQAGRAMHHLSADGQKAMVDVLQARDLLSQGKVDAAIPPLYDAQKRLAAAAKDNRNFMAAESQLQPTPQHPAPTTHKPSAGTVTWIPVGGEFIVTDTLAPEKKTAAQAANQQLKAGQTQQAQQNVQVVGEDADFIVALAPLEPAQGALNRATVFTEGRQAAPAVEALDDLLSGIVFVSDDFFAQAVPDKGQAAAKKSQ